MHKDRRGLALTTESAQAAEAFNAAVGDYLEYRLTAGERVKAALAADAGFVMGHALRGYFMLLLGSNSSLPLARKALDEARAGSAKATRREQMHVAALEAWCAGDTPRACDVWEALLAENPTDVLALRLQHFAAFWLGRAHALRDTPAGVLPAWDPAMPGYGNVLGMLAFGLEECGDYAAAEKAGRQAVEVSRDDLWAVHAVAHVLEMQGRLKDGMTWLAQPAGAWGDRNPFKDHLWWHTALFPLEAGDYQRVLALYDAEVELDETGFYLDVQNAASLLLRLEFCGVDVGRRWELLANVAEKRVGDHVLAFTDTHFMMALARGGRREAAERMLASLDQLAVKPDGPAIAGIAAALTKPVCEAIVAFADRNFERTIELLMPLRHSWQGLGASHAQRDIFSQILIEAAIGARRTPLARQLLAQRTTLRPHSRYSWMRYADALDACGEAPAAQIARQRAAAVH